MLSLFILWENTIRNSAHKVVNEIFTQIPESIPTAKKLPAMAYYLAKNRLEKQFETVEGKDKLHAGVLIPCEVYSEYENSGLLKAINRAGDYIFNEFEPIEYKGVEYYLLFNINQSTFWHKEVLEKIEVYFTLHRKYYLKLRQALVADFSKQGLDLYRD